MGRKENNDERKVKRSINFKLVVTIIPMIVISMALIVAVIFIRGNDVIRDLLYTSLQNEVSTDAGEVNKSLNSTFYYINGISDTVEYLDFKSDDEILSYLNTTLDRYGTCPTGVYLATEDDKYYNPTGFVPSKPVTTSDWYQQGIGYNDTYFYYYDEPYFDSYSGDLCATVIRHVHLKDGREGVIAADIMMSSLQEFLNNVQVYDNGGAMLVTSKGMILSYKDDPSVCGQNLSDQTDAFLQHITSLLTAEDDSGQSVETAKGRYLAFVHTVDGTDWKVIAYAKVSDVYGTIYRMITVIAVLLLIVLAIIIVVLLKTLSDLIKKPVAALTENIALVSAGDFTADIHDGGNDEIAYMNNSMGDFVRNMRHSLSDIHSVTERLVSDAKSSEETAKDLKSAAGEQSESMDQIRANVSNMADAVTEVAENATSLAQTVTDMVTNEQEIEKSMKELVVKADNGQKDMKNVATGMDNVMKSMSDMNEAVMGVDSAAQEINQIIDLINSISSQTNLLSLNASIEAARAGEAGKGFAVVATEIGQLANNSAEATKQIAEIIQDMTGKVHSLSEKAEANTKLINNNAASVEEAAETFLMITEELSNTSNTLSEMAVKMENVNDVATNLASVSEEQSASTQEISATVERVSESARAVAEASGIVSDSANSVSTAVDTIGEQVEKFKI